MATAMKKIFGFKKKKDKTPPVTLEEATEKINKRGDVTDEKIKKLDAELLLFKEYIDKTRPGPAQDALKARALRVLKQKKMYEAQRDMLYNQSFKLERVSFATEGIKDARETLAAMKAGSKDLKVTMKALKIDEVDKLQDVISDIVEESNEVQDSLLQSQTVPDQLDEDDLFGELDELEQSKKTMNRAEIQNVLQQESAKEFEHSEHRPQQEVGMMKAGEAEEAPEAASDEPSLPPLLPRSSIQT